MPLATPCPPPPPHPHPLRQEGSVTQCLRLSRRCTHFRGSNMRMTHGSEPLRCTGNVGNGTVCARAVLKGPDFFLLRTALKDHPKGPPTANRQLPSTANRHQPPTTNRQPPTAANRQRRPTANCQPLPTATNHQSPTTNRPPTATNRQLPTANRQPPLTANRQHG